jgi:hypothetical protein
MSDRLAEIRARLDAATPGPWDYDHITRNVEADSRWLPDKRHVVAPMVGHFDGTLIAHAPADIAWLLDEVERLRQFAQHDDFCDLIRCAGSEFPTACSCGLDVAA